jgi:hypothetical protein
VDGTAQVQPKQIPTDIGMRLPGRWRTLGVLALGGVIAVIGLVVVLRQTGFFEKQRPQSQNQGQSTSLTRNSTPAPTKTGGEGTEDQVATVAKRAPSTQPQSSVTNLLSAENGGHVIAGTNDQWLYAIDGDEKNWQYIDIGLVGSWAVYGFKDGKSASFDTFKVLILGTESWNLKEFELLSGNDSPTGKFESIGKFQTQNIRFFKNPYQEFKFPPVKARYLKVKVISSHGFSSVGVYEFQLIGLLEK